MSSGTFVDPAQLSTRRLDFLPFTRSSTASIGAHRHAAHHSEDGSDEPSRDNTGRSTGQGRHNAIANERQAVAWREVNGGGNADERADSAEHESHSGHRIGWIDDDHPMKA